MKMKNFFLAGLAGGVADYLLGWLVYGILLLDYLGGGKMPVHMEFIACGCLCFGLLLSYIYVKWASIATFAAGMRAGLGIGTIMGLMENFFDASMKAEAFDIQKFLVSVVVSAIMTAIVGGIVGWVNGSLSKPASA